VTETEDSDHEFTHEHVREYMAEQAVIHGFTDFELSTFYEPEGEGANEDRVDEVYRFSTHRDGEKYGFEYTVDSDDPNPEGIQHKSIDLLLERVIDTLGGV